MFEKIKSLINKKHIIIVGGTELERRFCINEIINFLNLETFRFSKELKTISQYYNECDTHNTYIYGDPRDSLAHVDWIKTNKSLVILEEFQFMEKPFSFEVINYYIEASDRYKKNQNTVKLIISIDEENDILEELSKITYTGTTEPRTKKQVVEQNIEVVNISKI